MFGAPGACIWQAVHQGIEYGLQEGLNPGDDLREIQGMIFERLLEKTPFDMHVFDAFRNGHGITSAKTAIVGGTSGGFSKAHSNNRHADIHNCVPII